MAVNFISVGFALLHVMYLITSFKHFWVYVPLHDKTNKMICAPSEDSDQPWHLPSLIRVFAVIMKKSWVLSYLLSAQRRLWSDWADGRADPSSLALMSFCWLCPAAAQCIVYFLSHNKAKPTKWHVCPTKTSDFRSACSSAVSAVRMKGALCPWLSTERPVKSLRRYRFTWVFEWCTDRFVFVFAEPRLICVVISFTYKTNRCEGRHY